MTALVEHLPTVPELAPAEENPVLDSGDLEPDQDFPLERSWGLWWSPPEDKSQVGGDAAQPVAWYEFGTVINFWRCYNNLPTPTMIPLNGTLSIFQHGVEPTWEDPQNKLGGRWTFGVPEGADQVWGHLCLGLVGETLDPTGDILGVVLARRKMYIRFSVWTRDRTQAETNLAIGDTLRGYLKEVRAALEIGRAHV